MAQRSDGPFVCSGGCHTWYRIIDDAKDDDQEPRSRHAQTYVHTNLRYKDVLSKSHFCHWSPPNAHDQIDDNNLPEYHELVRQICDGNWIESVIDGTNQHITESGDGTPLISRDRAGREEIRIFICILIRNGMRRGKIDTMWSSDINIGAHDLTC